MSSEIVEIAEAVKAEMNAAAPGTFSQAFTAERKYVPAATPEDLADLAVTVVPKAEAEAISGRAATTRDVQVDVGIQKRLAGDGNAERDALMALAREIIAFFRLRRLSTYAAAAWVGTRNEPIYDPEHMDQSRVFTSVVTLTYRLIG